MTTLIDTTHLRTGDVRLSFPALFEAKPQMSTDPKSKLKYQATLLLPPDTDLRPFAQILKGAAVERFGKMIEIDPGKNPIKKCTGQYEGYDEGWHFIRCTSERRPGVVDRTTAPVSDPERVYPGLYVRAFIHGFGWTYGSKPGLSFGLDAIQIVRDGDRLGGAGGATNAADMFEPLGLDEDGGAADVATGGGLDDLFS